MLPIVKQNLVDSVHRHQLKVVSIGDRVKIPRPRVRSRNGFVVDGILVVR